MLKAHYLRWVLFPIKGETYFMYQGIFDTDFDKYTEDAVTSLQQVRASQTVFENLEGISEGLADESRPRSSSSSATTIVRASSNISEHPYVSVRGNQESAQAQGGFLDHARPDAVTKLASDSVRRQRIRYA